MSRNLIHFVCRWWPVLFVLLNGLTLAGHGLVVAFAIGALVLLVILGDAT